MARQPPPKKIKLEDGVVSVKTEEEKEPDDYVTLPPNGNGTRNESNAHGNANGISGYGIGESDFLTTSTVNHDNGVERYANSNMDTSANPLASTVNEYTNETENKKIPHGGEEGPSSSASSSSSNSFRKYNTERNEIDNTNGNTFIISPNQNLNPNVSESTSTFIKQATDDQRGAREAEEAEDKIEEETTTSSSSCEYHSDAAICMNYYCSDAATERSVSVQSEEESGPHPESHQRQRQHQHQQQRQHEA
eukprot:CAMPEP_0203667680 /NCGR_PEP_ID=MMETSP0090-20130426/4477_1 /ASSEMBLY_ACC=CAM_ASM_001088 /TAXON_ID=426623 /ORGANISM="Chaetoceros affinis, Strain CCMP159" /LENGTH=249 /DNA_ID=CAMNT_0050531917 /DNA_START=48 /DNA_END=794 /DNA_ORIENTATION=-